MQRKEMKFKDAHWMIFEPADRSRHPLPILKCAELVVLDIVPRL